MLFLKILFREIYHLVRSRESRAFLGLAWRYGDAARYQAQSIRFLKYHFRVPDARSFLWQFKEIFVEQAYHFEASTPTPLIFDCGANVGTSCAYFKQRYPRAYVKAFEADPAIASYLAQNLTENGFTGVEIIAKAVWVDDLGIELGQEGADAASILATGSKILVPSIRLRDWLAAETRVDMLKIDIEGAETAVLKDCASALGCVQHLFVEYHAFVGQPQELDQVLAVLRDNRFRYFIRDAQDRPQPLSNRAYRGNATMDLQLNIFAYRE